MLIWIVLVVVVLPWALVLTAVLAAIYAAKFVLLVLGGVVAWRLTQNIRARSR